MRVLQEATDYANGIGVVPPIYTHRAQERIQKYEKRKAQRKNKMIIEQQAYETIPGGLYAGKITSIVQEEKDFLDGKGPQKQLHYTVTLDDGTELPAWSSMAFSQKSKLYKWTQAIVFNGAAIPPDYILDTDVLMNKRVMVTIILAPKKDNPNIMVNRVDGFNPMPQTNAKKQQQIVKTVRIERPADLAAAVANLDVVDEAPEVQDEPLAELTPGR
jgi:hypothetical protein